MLRDIKTVHIVMFFAAIFILFLFILFFLFFIKETEEIKKITVFDLKKTYAVFLQQASTLPKQRVNVLAQKFPQAVTKAVNIYAKKHHTTVFVKDAVISGAQDVTPDIQILIAKEMQKNA